MSKRFTMMTVLLLAAFGQAAPANTAHVQQSRDRSAWTWQRSDDGMKIEVRVEGKVEFAEDYSDVQQILGDGVLRIRDERTAEAKRYVVTRGADGQLKRSYSVNGEARAFDPGAREWLRGVLLLAARQGGLDARTRVKRILQRGGTKGLIEEISRIEGDYARRIYFEELLKVESLDAATLTSVLRDASKQISSDYERAQLLLHVADVYLVKSELLPIYFEATDRIDSDYEHRRVLSAALKKNKLGQNALLKMLKSSSAIQSDYEKATFLIEAAQLYAGETSLRAAFLEVVETINSDYERGRVLSNLAKKNILN
ncbi:MAG: hypothetical protein LC742_08485 [Acidobacteria bacterium]|nr:hypothetical protein [Acidobacteriota bacterium]